MAGDQGSKVSPPGSPAPAPLMQPYSPEQIISPDAESISQLCPEARRGEQTLFLPLSPGAGPAEWMAAERRPDRKINASYQEASGVRLRVHVNKLLVFLMLQSYHFPPVRASTVTCVVKP